MVESLLQTQEKKFIPTGLLRLARSL